MTLDPDLNPVKNGIVTPRDVIIPVLDLESYFQSFGDSRSGFRSSKDGFVTPLTPTYLYVLLELDPSGGLLPLHLSVLVEAELLHLGEERVRLVARVAVLVLAQDELHALRRRRHCGGRAFR